MIASLLDRSSEIFGRGGFRVMYALGDGAEFGESDNWFYVRLPDSSAQANRADARQTSVAHEVAVDLTGRK